MIIKDAIEVLKATYQSLEVVAMGLPVDASEAAKAFAKATPDTEEYLCLKALTKMHPIPSIQPEPEVQPEE